MNVAIIPARGGSRRIPKKNIREFHGKPIIAYSIEAARESGLFDHIFVSSDDREILKVARQLGAKAMERELRYAFDEVGTQEVVRDGLVEMELFGVVPEYVCCIYPCAPMLTANDLVYGYELLKQATKPTYFYIPGIFYWGRGDYFADGLPLEGNGMVIGTQPIEHYIDINTFEDWAEAEAIYAALHKEAV